VGGIHEDLPNFIQRLKAADIGTGFGEYADPWAVKNLATDPTHTAALATMRAEMQHWREFTGDRDIHPREIKRRTDK